MNIQKIMLTAVTASSLLASNTDAYMPAENPNGLVHSLVTSVGAGFLWTHATEGAASEIDNESFAVIEGAARASIPVHDNISFQFDLDGFLGLNERGNGEDTLQNYYFTTLHLNWREPESWSLGILGIYGESNGGEDEEAQIWAIGGEGQLYFEDFTIYGQGGYMEANDENEYDVLTDAWWVRVQGRYFISDDSRAQAEVAYIDGNERSMTSGAPNVSGWAWGGRWDHVLGEGPVSFFVDYFGTHIDNNGTGSGDLTDHAITVGVEMALGAENKRHENNYGVTFDSIARALGHWCGWSLSVVD